MTAREALLAALTVERWGTPAALEGERHGRQKAGRK